MKKRKFEIVADRIEKMVEDGELSAGEKIPSVRMEATRAGMSMMTVLEGYKLLVERQIIESRPQSGYFVRPPHLRNSEPWIKPPQAKMVDFSRATKRVALSDRARILAKNAARIDAIPLGSECAAQEYFPDEELSIIAAKALRSQPLESNKYHLDFGHISLRTELAKKMIEAGCETDAEDIIVTSGASQALLFAIKALCKPGDSVAVESPGNHRFYAFLEYLDLNAVEIPSDPITGISIKDVEESSWNDNVKCLLTAANLANPTGATMPDDAKRDLVNICSAKRIPIIEDDTFGELSFSNKRGGALKSFSEDNVIYIGSLSKSLAPGYRIGWIAPGVYLKEVEREYRINLSASTLPTQMAVAAFLKDGSMTHHLNKLRMKLKENMALFQREIAKSFPTGTSSSHPDGGHFLWIELPFGVDTATLAGEAIKHDITIAPGLLFSSQQQYGELLRINTGLPWSPEIAEAIKFLGEAAARMLKTADV